MKTNPFWWLLKGEKRGRAAFPSDMIPVKDEELLAPCNGRGQIVGWAYTPIEIIYWLKDGQIPDGQRVLK